MVKFLLTVIVMGVSNDFGYNYTMKAISYFMKAGNQCLSRNICTAMNSVFLGWVLLYLRCMHQR